MLGFAEQLEFLEIVPDDARCRLRAARAAVEAMMLGAARATCGSLHRRRGRATAFHTGTPAPRDWRRSATGAIDPSDPFNDHEPVDSSAAAIGAQGLLAPRPPPQRDAADPLQTRYFRPVSASWTRSWTPPDLT